MADSWVGMGHQLDADRKLKFLFSYADYPITKTVADIAFVECIGCRDWRRPTTGAIRSDREHPVIVAVNDVVAGACDGGEPHGR